MPAVCDIALSPVEVTEETLTCNGGSQPYVSPLLLTGTSSEHGVSLANTDVHIILSNLTINAQIAMNISQSNVVLILDGTNNLVSQAGAAVECRADSNITLQSTAFGSLYARAVTDAAGIGAGRDTACQTIMIINGSLEVSGGPGIGTSPSDANETSQLRTLLIREGDIRAMGVTGGSGIGTGSVENGGVSIIGQVSLSGNITASSFSKGCGIGTRTALSLGRSAMGNVSIFKTNLAALAAVGSSGSGIGSSLARDGWSRMDNLTIANCTITTRNDDYGAGIGAGCCKYGGYSKVGQIVLLNVDINATTSSYGSAIGSADGFGSGSISVVDFLMILNGNITVNTTCYGAGIGSSLGDGGESKVGNLVLLNANVTATSTSYGPGIGSGIGQYGGLSEVGNITILNGTVHAHTYGFEVYASAIGTARAFRGTCAVQNLVMMNVNITAIAGDYGSGIGNPSSDFDATVLIGNLTLLNCTVYATASLLGAGIGTASGYYESASSHIENLLIVSGTITASTTASSTAAIGTGYAHYGTSTIGNILIIDANVTASSFSEGSAIGTGKALNSGTSKVGQLAIVNSIVSASCSAWGAGIGTAFGSNRYGSSRIDTLIIVNGTTNATSFEYGCGIGCGYSQNGGQSTIGTLSLIGGTITAHGTLADIGCGQGGSVDLLRFSGNQTILCNSDNSAEYCINANSIVLSNGSLSFATHRDRLFDVYPSIEGSINLMIRYGTVTSDASEHFPIVNSPVLQIGNLSLPSIEPWTFCVAGSNNHHCYANDLTDVKSFILTVPSPGNYWIRASGDAQDGIIRTNDVVSLFDVQSSRDFISEAHFLPFATRTPPVSPSPSAAFTISLFAGVGSRFKIIRATVFVWALLQV
jgi:hypothetical protein